MKRILLGLVTIVGAVSAVWVGTTGAFFSDTETSSGNTFAAGAIDLKVDNESYYNGLPNPGTTWSLDNLANAAGVTIHKFFDFSDLKPDDWGEDTVSLHIDTNDAYLCANVTLTSNNENGCNDPESGVDSSCGNPGEGQGELAGLVNFVWWADDGDNVLEQGENVISSGPIGALPIGQPYNFALADSQTNIWNEGETGGPVTGGETYHIGKAWCFGAIGEAPLPQSDYSGPDDPANDGQDTSGPATPEDGGITCDGTTLGNESQTDSLTADVSFEAVQSRNNADFLCEETTTTRACTAQEEYANAYYNVDQGRLKNGSAVTADRSNPSYALGAPQSTGTPYDNPVVANSFFSLGFKSTPVGVTATTTPGGSIVLSFPGSIVNGAGADLKLWEVTGGTSYPDEKVKVEVSDNLAGPWTVVAASATRDAEIDIAPVASAKYVRITDVSVPSQFEATADGFDLDAVQALNCEIPVAD